MSKIFILYTYIPTNVFLNSVVNNVYAEGPTLYAGRGRTGMLLDNDVIHSIGQKRSKLKLSEGGLKMLDGDNREGQQFTMITWHI